MERNTRRLRSYVLYTALSAVFAATLVLWARWVSRAPDVASITGAVLREDPDPNKQRPIAHARIEASTGVGGAETTSDANGFFSLPLRPAIPPGASVRLTFRHPDYNAYTTAEPASDQLQIVRLTPRDGAAVEAPKVSISNVRLRYALRSTSTVEVGSTARVFQIPNTGNVPCEGRPPCSPDGRWKATIRPISIDAGADQQFRNTRVSCIAGPCPFTKIESDDYLRGGRVIRVAVRNWSDPVTYVVEAEVTRTANTDIVRYSFPVIFGRSMHFTLPQPGEGPSIEAEVDGAPIVFPLGPKLKLSWAVCRMEAGPEGARLYRCDLNPQYQFK